MVTTPRTSDEDARPTEQESAALVALRETLGADVHLWSRPLDSPTAMWQCLTAGHGPEPDLPLSIAEQAALPGADRVLTQVDSARWRVVLPIRGAAGHQLLASAEVSTTDPELLVRLAAQAQRQLELQWQVQLLSEERDLLICQANEDVDELAFLRRTAEHLCLTRKSLDVNELAQIVLPQLRERLHAEAVMLVSAGRDKASFLVGRPVVAVGSNCLDDRACMQLVEQFCRTATSQPCVRNDCQDAPNMQMYKGLRSFVLAPMLRSQSVIAWLLAVNRLYTLRDVTSDGRLEPSQHRFGASEVSLLRSTAAILATHAVNIELLRDKEQLFLDMVRALVNAVEAKDQYTFGHSERVGLYARNLGSALGLKAKTCRRIHLAGLLHDVGKIAVPDALLANAQCLDDDEFASVQQHVEDGWSILYGLEALDDVLLGVLHHHERWDGTGYPDGLQGTTIPLDARILAVADSYDAMTSDRPYRRALPQDRAEAILRQGAGTQWDPELVEVFLGVMPEMLLARQNYQPRVTPARRGYAMLRDLGYGYPEADAAPV